MLTTGLLVRLKAHHGVDAAVQNLLTSALPLVQNEPATIAWFAVRFGSGEYGIFDVFPDDAGRDAHLNGNVAQALREKGPTLFSKPPHIVKLRVLAHKLPGQTQNELVAKVLILAIAGQSGHAQEVEPFLIDALRILADEPKTVAWFAFRTEDGQYGMFDVFPDNAGRFAHLTGDLPRALARHACTLLGGIPDLEMIEVLAAKLPTSELAPDRATAAVAR